MSVATLERIEVPAKHSVATALLIDKLKEGTIGDVLTDEELTEVCDRDTRPKGKCYSNLGSAINYCEREHQIVWQRLRDANAIKCLNASETRSSAHTKRRHIYKTGKRGMQQMACVIVADLPEEDRTAFRGELAQMATLTMFAANKTTKKIVARSITEKVNIDRLLELMR